MTIVLGNIAKDKISGFTGVVIGHTKALTNVDRFTLQPRELKDGKPLQSHSFDVTSLDFVSESEIVPIAVDRPKDEVALGDVVKHPLTGLVGVVTGITSWIEGCSIITLQPRELKDGLPVAAQAFDERSLVVEERANPPARMAKTGGPRSEPSRGRDKA